MSYEELWKRLTEVYDEREAKAVAQYVLDVGFGLSFPDLLCYGLQRLTAEEQQRLELMTRRLEQAEPVQYVLGVADFCGRTFHVAPGVLIPRPETAELCRWIVSEQTGEGNGRLLDIGTGSGCIACTLAAELPEAHVTGWDISAQALSIARNNARLTGVNVDFKLADILNTRPAADEHWNLIVSNPPYIYIREQVDMGRNVLDYEPHEALFAPDDNPMLFYLCISDYAKQTLVPGGSVYMELNPMLADATASYLHRLGMCGVEIRNDQFGKQRFMKATKP